jgi:hypothetical protein
MTFVAVFTMSWFLLGFQCDLVAQTSRLSGLSKATPTEDENRDERIIEKMDFTDSDSQSDREIEVNFLVVLSSFVRTYNLLLVV